MSTDYRNSDDVLSAETKLADEVSNALLNDAMTHDSAIEVINEHGVITLEGKVNDYETRQRAEAIAKGHSGVISVVNSLKVV